MKICLIGPAHPLRGGIAHYNTQLALELAVRHKVTLISFSRQYPALLFPGRSQLDPSQPPPGLVIEPLLDSLNPLSWLRAARRIVELSPDLIVIQWWNPFFALPIGTVTRLIKRRLRAAVAFVCHNILPHEPVPGTLPLTRFATALGDAFILHSEADRRHLLSIRPAARTLLLPLPPGRGFGRLLGKEEARERLGLKGHVLLFFGLIRKYKGLPWLIDAMPQILEHLECTLLVVGEFYEGKQHCQDRIQSLGVASKIRIVDRFVPDEELNLYFSAADLVVLPYESATQSAIVPIAYAFERPVVATRVGGLPEAVREGETGLLVEPRNPAALAGAILRFYRDGLEERFRQRIRQRQADFSWKDLAAVIETLPPGS